MKNAGLEGNLTWKHRLSKVENHSDAIVPLIESGLRGAVLLNIDGHSDMKDRVFQKDLSQFLPETYAATLDADNTMRRIKWLFKSYLENLGENKWICSAVHMGIISEVYWANPYDRNGQIFKLGTRQNDQTISLQTSVKELNDTFYQGNFVVWQRYMCNKFGALSPFAMHPVTEEPVPEGAPFILSIDYDAAACEKPVEIGGKPVDVSTGGYKKRIAMIEDLLHLVPNPDLIILASSTNEHSFRNYVPKDLVKNIDKKIMNVLERVYSTT